MRIREWFIANVRKIIIFLLAILFVAIVVVVVIRSAKSARLVIMVTPASANVIINGEKYVNGTYDMFPKKINVEIVKGDFEHKEYELELESHKTATIYEVLSQDDGKFDWYNTHDEDYEILKLINDKKTSEYIKKREKAKEISAVLPLHKSTILDDDKLSVDGKSYYETIIKNGANDPRCTGGICLLVKDNTNGTKVIEELIKGAGYDIKDYEIIYE